MVFLTRTISGVQVLEKTCVYNTGSGMLLIDIEEQSGTYALASGFL